MDVIDETRIFNHRQNVEEHSVVLLKCASFGTQQNRGVDGCIASQSKTRFVTCEYTQCEGLIFGSYSPHTCYRETVGHIRSTACSVSPGRS